MRNDFLVPKVMPAPAPPGIAEATSATVSPASN